MHYSAVNAVGGAQAKSAGVRTGGSGFSNGFSKRYDQVGNNNVNDSMSDGGDSMYNRSASAGGGGVSIGASNRERESVKRDKHRSQMDAMRSRMRLDDQDSAEDPPNPMMGMNTNMKGGGKPMPGGAPSNFPVQHMPTIQPPPGGKGAPPGMLPMPHPQHNQMRM